MVADSASGGGGSAKPAGAHSWTGHRSAAGFDLRSDIATAPTPFMLAAVQATTHLDDVYREDTATNELEEHVARLTGKEAGLFVLSGTMGNQVALRALLTQPPHAVLCDSRAHIFTYEAGGVSSLTGALVKTVTPTNGMYLTLDEIKANADLDSDVHTCPTRVISLENTLNGMVTPLAETRRIAEFARQNGVLMHLDGARLWEAVASGAGSLAEYAACFDTVTLCFSKGLGAPAGSVLVGPARVIEHARWIRKSIGGGLHKSGVLTSAARAALDETFGSDPDGRGGLLPRTHELALEVEAAWTALGGALHHPTHTNMFWPDLDAAGVEAARFAEIGWEEGLKLRGNRLVLHYQIYLNRDEVLPRLRRVFERALAEGNGKGALGRKDGPRSQYRL